MSDCPFCPYPGATIDVRFWSCLHTSVVWARLSVSHCYGRRANHTLFTVWAYTIDPRPDRATKVVPAGTQSQETATIYSDLVCHVVFRLVLGPWKANTRVYRRLFTRIHRNLWRLFIIYLFHFIYWSFALVWHQCPRSVPPTRGFSAGTKRFFTCHLFYFHSSIRNLEVDAL